MLSHLIKKEVLSNIKNLRILILATFCVVLTPLSGLINYLEYQERLSTFNDQAAQHESGNDNSELRIYYPPPLLSVLARGNSLNMPHYHAIGVAGNNLGVMIAGNNDSQDFRVLSTTGNFDFLFLVNIVFSLLAIIVSHDMIAGEKEHGTLRAIMSNSVSRSTLVSAKWVGGYMILWLTVLLGFMLMWMMLIVMDSRFALTENVLRMILIFFTTSLFLAAVYSLGLMLSAIGWSTQITLVSLLVVWVFFQLVIPKASEKLASILRPIKSSEVVRLEKRAIINSIKAQKQKRAGMLYKQITGIDSGIQGKNIVGSLDEAKKFRAAYTELADELDRLLRSQLRMIDLNTTREREYQRNLAVAISLISPSSAITYLLTDAANTGDLTVKEYLDQTDNYYTVVDQQFFKPIQASEVTIDLGFTSASYRISEAPDLEDLPNFTVSPLPLGKVLTGHSWAILSLFLTMVFGIVATHLLFQRYDVR